MWQKAREIDPPHREVWVEAKPPHEVYSLTHSDFVMAFSTNIRCHCSNFTCQGNLAVEACSVELLPEFRAHVEMVEP